MLKTTRIVAAFLVLLLPPTAQAITVNGTVLDCTPITLSNGGLFDACATTSVTTPSIVQVNGTTASEGNLSSAFEFYTGLDSGVDTTTLSKAKLQATNAGIEVVVSRNANGDCSVNVTVSGVTNTCTFCSYCSQDNYSADCTNIKNGRMVDCESTATGSVYFPLTAEAVGLNATFVLQNSTGVVGTTVPVPSKSPTSRSNQTASTKTSGGNRKGKSSIVLIGSVLTLSLVL